jgi:hypothetical protein
MWSKQCNVEFGYQLSICSRTEENHGKPWSSWPSNWSQNHSLSYSLGADSIGDTSIAQQWTSSVVQNARILVCYLAMNVFLLLSVCVEGMCLPSCCLAMDICVIIWFRTGPYGLTSEWHVFRKVLRKKSTYWSVQDVRVLDCINVHTTQFVSSWQA